MAGPGAGGVNATGVAAGQLGDQVEAEAVAARFAAQLVARAVETLEDALGFPWGKADAVIAEGDLGLPAG